MPLLREEFGTSGPGIDDIITHHQEIVDKVEQTTIALVHGMTRIGDKGHFIAAGQDKNSFDTDRAYHLQDGLPADHEIAVWGTVRGSTCKLLQQVVCWEGDELDTEVPLTDPRTILERDVGGDLGVVTMGVLRPDASHEAVMDHLQDVHDTVAFFVNAFNYRRL